MKKGEKERKEELARRQCIKQIEETKKLIEKSTISTTELINSLLSLVILPYEKMKRVGYFVVNMKSLRKK